MQQPLISIIVPIYNVEDYLDDCIRSLVQQTYKNIEIILVDDGSSDRCPAICDRFAKEDARIQVVHQQNAGVAAARNTGMKQMQGIYIGFVDGDDWVEPTMYEKLYSIISEQEADIAVCGFIREYPTKQKKVQYGDGILAASEAFEILVKDNMAGGSAPWNKLYKKQVFTDITYPVGRQWEDLLTIYKTYEKADKVVFTSELLYHYLQRETSTIYSFRGIEDSHRVLAFHDRARILESKHKQLALQQFDGNANECMHNCIKIFRMNNKITSNFKETFAIGKKSYEKIKHYYPMGLKRKLIYQLFFEYTDLFLYGVRIMPFIK